jgi:hypothetical protein
VLCCRLDGKVLPRVYEHAVIKKSEHRGCCYLNGTERIPVKGKVSGKVIWEFHKVLKMGMGMEWRNGDGMGTELQGGGVMG